MRLDGTAKVQIRVGEAYGNRIEALTRFVRTYSVFDNAIRRRLVIENVYLCNVLPISSIH